ncbi:tRNA-dihydrouridine(47) synthase [NAD(P)(+)]-like isoform X2 [Eurosta solidaginis]
MIEPCMYENCRFLHDMGVFMTSKPDDIGDKCPVFDATGYCKRGVTCRFSHAHMDEFGLNIISDDYDEKKEPTILNGITSALQFSLRKREYDFTRSKLLVAQADNLRDEKKKKLPNIKDNSHNHTEECVVEDTSIKTTNTPRASSDMDTAADKGVSVAKEPSNTGKTPIGAAVDDNETSGRDIAMNKTPVDFVNKLILSPLTTVGNLPFRRICKEFGADITCGEMACAAPIVKGLTQEWALTKRHISEDVFGVQLCGNNPNIIAQAAQLLQETTKIEYIDLNIGCPIELIYNHGGGCALMRRTNILETVVRSCSTMSSQIPFTVKMRTGIYADKSIAHDLMPLVEEWGAAAVTLHGRSREQRYTKNANWQYIEECAAKVQHIPVIGNGDILNFEDYNEKRKIAPHVSSVMIGRGALIKPWIFKEIKEQKPWNPTSTERFEILRTYVNYGLEHWGTDTKGVENTRRFLLEWQSFLYRYIPYELLAYPPQQINQRPKKFRGRDEMETLMSSPNSEDWVRLSEMLLGPVPDEFKFVPKHKANAY